MIGQDFIQHNQFLITGGAGFVGSHIAEYLLNNGAKKVRVIDNLITGQRSNIQLLSQYPNFEFLEADIRDYDNCLQVMQDIDYVSHQAALGSVPRSIQDPIATNSHNVDGSLNIFRAAVEKKVKQIVYASSSSVYGDEPNLPKVEEKIGNPLSPYAVSKKTNELYANVFYKTYGLKILGLRYFNIFGPRQDPGGPYAAVIPLFVKGILTQGDVFINGNGEQTRDFTFVENAVQANLKALSCKEESAFGSVFNIAVGENFSVKQMYAKIQNLLNSNHPAQFREQRKGDILNSLADISKAKNILDYQPSVKFDEGLARTVDFFRNKYSAID